MRIAAQDRPMFSDIGRDGCRIAKDSAIEPMDVEAGAADLMKAASELSSGGMRFVL
jgi:hypothetical protein